MARSVPGLRTASLRSLHFYEVCLVLRKFEAVWDFLVFKSIGDLLLENFQLVLHLRVDIPFRIRDKLAQSSVANLVPVLSILDFDISLPLRWSVGHLDRVIAELDNLVTEKFLSSLLAGRSNQPFLSFFFLHLFELGGRECWLLHCLGGLVDVCSQTTCNVMMVPILITFDLFRLRP